MHSDSVFSPPRYYKSFTCPNKVSLLFGLNSKLVPHSRGASPDQILAAFQVKNNRTKKVSSTTPWQGDFTVIRKLTWRKTRIYPRPTLQSWPSFVPARGSLINLNQPSYSNQIIEMVAASSLFKVGIKTFEKLSKAVWSPPSSTSTLNTLPDFISVSRYTQLSDVNCLVLTSPYIPITSLRSYTRRRPLKPDIESSASNLPGHHGHFRGHAGRYYSVRGHARHFGEARGLHGQSGAAKPLSPQRRGEERRRKKKE